MKWIPFFIFLLLSCRKEDKRQYSEWYVNGERFSTNEAKVIIGKSSMSLAVQSNMNGFSIAFAFGAMTGPNKLPTYGNWPIRKTANQNPDSVTIKFYAHGRFYFISPGDYYLLSEEENGKAKYVLPPTAFYNHEDSNITYIAGTFREP